MHKINYTLRSAFYNVHVLFWFAWYLFFKNYSHQNAIFVQHNHCYLTSSWSIASVGNELNKWLLTSILKSTQRLLKEHHAFSKYDIICFHIQNYWNFWFTELHVAGGMLANELLFVTRVVEERYVTEFNQY